MIYTIHADTSLYNSTITTLCSHSYAYSTKNFSSLFLLLQARSSATKEML